MRSEPPPKPGFGRREAQEPKNNGTRRRSAGSASARTTRPAGKEGATWGNQGWRSCRSCGWAAWLTAQHPALRAALALTGRCKGVGTSPVATTAPSLRGEGETKGLQLGVLRCRAWHCPTSLQPRKRQETHQGFPHGSKPKASAHASGESRLNSTESTRPRFVRRRAGITPRERIETVMNGDSRGQPSSLYAASRPRT